MMTEGVAPSGQDAAPLAYRQQDSAQTLAEGLAEYYAANADRIQRPADLPTESRALFRCHDTCHVIFGLDATLEDEALVDLRTLLSCDVGLLRYGAYLAQDKQARMLFKEIGLRKTVWATVLGVPRICQAVIEAWRTKQRWPWVTPAAYQNRTLADLRSEYRIRVL